MRYSRNFWPVTSTAAICACLAAGISAGAERSPSAANELEEVIVTGSRVVTNGNDSPTPVTVVNVAETEAVRPGTIADQLNDMPQFWGSQGQSSAIGGGGANVGGGGNGTGNGQANVLNLRSFGATRTLILFDGHRVAPTSANGQVDVDMIPQILLQRVDVVTGGASAVYGADAITGVVNFVTDTKFKGLKINGQVGRTAQNDGDSRSIGIGWGADLFGGRGHLLASYEFRGDDGVDKRSDRAWFRQRPGVYQIGSVAATATARAQSLYGLYLNTTRNTASYGGTLGTFGTTNPLAGNYFSSNNVLSPVDFGTRIPNAAGTGFGDFSSGGSGLFFDASLRGELQMHQLFGRFDYDLTDSVHAWFKASGTDNYNAAHNIAGPLNSASNGSNFLNLFIDNPYLPAQYRTQMVNAGVSRFSISKFFGGDARQYTESFERQYSFDTGLSGTFGDGYKWELALIRADNEQRVRANNAFNGRRVAAAADAVTVTAANVGASGAAIGSIVCNVTLTNPGLYPGCVPMNLFGPAATSQEALNYIITPLEFTGHTRMDDVEAFVSGAPFNNWVGPVQMALSAQWRELSYRMDSTSIPNDLSNPLNCTGLRVLNNAAGATTCGAASQEYFQESSYAQPERKLRVKEAALEFDLPLLVDKFLSQDVSLNGAYRYTNYSTSGTVYSWKAGLDWKFNDSLSFRGTRSRDIRAPTMFELYRPTAVSNFNVQDTLTGCSHGAVGTCAANAFGPAAQVGPAGLFTSGNERLTPELADTVTAGLVFRPSWAQGLSVAVDAYYIKINDAIFQLNGTTPAVSGAGGACDASGGSSAACQLVVRPISCCDRSPGNTATRYFVTNVNIAQNWTQGIDLEINYANRAFDKPYNLRLLTSYQPHNVTVDPVGNLTQELAGSYASNPVLRSALMASISLTENLKVSILERWRQSMNMAARNYAPAPELVVVGGGKVAQRFYTNLNLGYTLPGADWGKAEIYFNIQNLFDEEPALGAAAGPNAFTQAGSGSPVNGDDVLGRNYTLGFRYRL